MKLCKRETFLYWLAHVFIWIVTALPTLIFVLRVSHPRHDDLNTGSNETHETTPQSPKVHYGCKNYTLAVCSNYKNSTQTHDWDQVQMVNTTNFPTNNTLCDRKLKILLAIQGCVHCGRLTKQSESWVLGDFCQNCSGFLTNGSSYSQKQLENITCASSGYSNEREGNKTCQDLLVMDENGDCHVPCDWSFMSSSLRRIFYGVMVLNMWLALASVVIVTITLATFKPMRTFPHILRFYILTSSVLYATASLLPLRIGLEKVYCSDDRYWNENGHHTKATIIEGATTHYFFLTFCFWSCCYVMNTYFVIVHNTQNIFLHKRKYHIIQFAFCSTLPAMLVGINIAAKPPGYKALFLDRMSSVFTSSVLQYVTFTLPIQITLGVAISLLWSLIRFVRKVRKNKTTLQAIRSDDDTTAFLNAEKQFTKLAFLFIITVAVVLSSEIIITYQNEEYIHQVEKYFECLKESDSCQKPAIQIFFLSSVKISGPGVFCVLNFFLLFFNKDTRDVWKKWFSWICGKLLCRESKYVHKSKNQRSNSGSVGTRPRSGTTDTNTSLTTTTLLTTTCSKPRALEKIAMKSQLS